MSDPKELRSTGLKVTAPRLRVLDLFQTSSERHLTAEDVYRRLLEDHADIGLATVYRVLTQFEQAGLLVRHHFEGGKAVYELKEGGHHDHLVCLQCGRVEEFCDSEIEDGAIAGFQLWVNLPAALKMSQPRYQEVNAATIPAAQRDGATIRVVAGEVDGVRGPVTEIAASPVYLDVTLEAGAEFVYPVPSDDQVLAYVLAGAGQFGAEEETVSAVSMVVFDEGDQAESPSSGGIEVRTESGVRFMLMAGAPFREPIAPYVPFVMITQQEIQQALYELRNGTFIKEEV